VLQMVMHVVHGSGDRQRTESEGIIRSKGKMGIGIELTQIYQLQFATLLVMSL